MTLNTAQGYEERHLLDAQRLEDDNASLTMSQASICSLQTNIFSNNNVLLVCIQDPLTPQHSRELSTRFLLFQLSSGLHSLC